MARVRGIDGKVGGTLGIFLLNEITYFSYLDHYLLGFLLLAAQIILIRLMWLESHWNTQAERKIGHQRELSGGHWGLLATLSIGLSCIPLLPWESPVPPLMGYSLAICPFLCLLFSLSTSWLVLSINSSSNFQERDLIGLVNYHCFR